MLTIYTIYRERNFFFILFFQSFKEVVIPIPLSNIMTLYSEQSTLRRSEKPEMTKNTWDIMEIVIGTTNIRFTIVVKKCLLGRPWRCDSFEMTATVQRL